MSETPTGPSVLVTGATGFLGSHLISALVRKGYRATALTRRPAGQTGLLELGVEVCQGDLGDPASLAKAVTGQHLVFHTAARVSDWGPRQDFERTNVAGTGNLVAACQRAGVARLVHVSSLTVLGLPRDGHVIDESSPTLPPRHGDFYSQSKLAGERLVREAHGQQGLATTVVRPGAIWGPGDPNVVPRIVALLRRGTLPLIGSGRNLLGLSHVSNLAEGLVMAGVAACAAGQLYHLTDGEEITCSEALDELAGALGLPRPRVSVPYWMLYGLAAVIEGLARLRRRTTPPPVSRYGVRFLACHSRYDIGKARRELGYRPSITFRAGVRSLAGLTQEPGDGPGSAPRLHGTLDG